MRLEALHSQKLNCTFQRLPDYRSGQIRQSLRAGEAPSQGLRSPVKETVSLRKERDSHRVLHAGFLQTSTH